MLKYVAEFMGVFLIVFLGDGVCANCFLNKSGMKGAGAVQITLGWGFAVMLPAFIFGSTSGAHFNPAVTLGFADNGKFPWNEVPGYLIAQMLGGFIGAIFVWLLFGDHFNATEDPGVIKGCFCTGPTIRNYPRNVFTEFMATGVLLFAICGFAFNPAANAVGINWIFVWAIIVSIGMSFGGLTGYALNPARDFGPRVAHAILPIKHKGSSDFAYSWVPIVGPVAGGIVFSLLYKAIYMIK